MILDLNEIDSRYTGKPFAEFITNQLLNVVDFNNGNISRLTSNNTSKLVEITGSHCTKNSGFSSKKNIRTYIKFIEKVIFDDQTTPYYNQQEAMEAEDVCTKNP